MQASPGFHLDTDKQLKNEANIESIPECQKYICLAIDEGRKKEELVYDKNLSQIIGFVKRGNFNNQLLEIECFSESQSHVATHMLVFNVFFGSIWKRSNQQFPNLTESECNSMYDWYT